MILAVPDEDGSDNSDADSVFIFQAIQRINPLAQIVCELVGSGSVSFLDASEQQRENSLASAVNSPRGMIAGHSGSIFASIDSNKSGNDVYGKEMDVRILSLPLPLVSHASPCVPGPYTSSSFAAKLVSSMVSLPQTASPSPSPSPSLFCTPRKRGSRHSKSQTPHSKP